MKRRCLIVSIIFLLLSCQASALDVVHEITGWAGVFLTKKLDDRWGLYFESQFRVGFRFIDDGRILFRPAAWYTLTPELSVWLGYGAFNLPDTGNHENRIWQQALYTKKVDLFLLLGRLRTEQRFIAGNSSPIFRARFMARGMYPNHAERVVSAVVWEELFQNLNPPYTGFDQNRAFVGANFNLSPTVQLEPGYLNQYVNREPDLDLVNHVLVAFVYLNF